MIDGLVVLLSMEGNLKDILNSGRRDQMEIMAAIAALTQKPSKFTHLMSQMHLTYTMLKNYLDLMLRLGLIEKREEVKAKKGCQVFQATEKGFTFLKIYCDILRLLYGEDFLKNEGNLAVACLKYCSEH